jgi:hypothetical protein
MKFLISSLFSAFFPLQRFFINCSPGVCSRLSKCQFSVFSALRWFFHEVVPQVSPLMSLYQFSLFSARALHQVLSQLSRVLLS